MTTQNILFLNHKKKQCGVYQYGVRLFDIIKQSNKYCFQYFEIENIHEYDRCCLLYTSPSPRDRTRYRMPSSA